MHIFSSYLTPLFTSLKKLESSQLNWIYEQQVTHTGNGVVHIWVLACIKKNKNEKINPNISISITYDIYLLPEKDRH